MKLLCYNRFYSSNGERERNYRMNVKSNMERTESMQKILEMLDKITDEHLLDRIYRFIKYLYIHNT